MYRIMIVVFIGLFHCKGPRNSYGQECEKICRFMGVIVNKKYQHTVDEDLHIILKIPSPIHAHTVSIVNQIINKEKAFPEI